MIVRLIIVRRHIDQRRTHRGVLEIRRTGVVEQQMLIPDALMRQLLSSGKLNIREVKNDNASPQVAGGATGESQGTAV
jgi:hypothetical protein